PIALALCAASLWLVYRGQFAATDRQPAQSDSPVRRNYAIGVAAGVMAMAVLGFNSVTAAAKVVHFKLEVPLRAQLYELPAFHRGWEMVGKDEILPDAIVEGLGTHDYVSRNFVRRADPA